MMATLSMQSSPPPIEKQVQTPSNINHSHHSEEMVKLDVSTEKSSHVDKEWSETSGTISCPIRLEWTGTSQFLQEDTITLQKMGHLKGIITYRQALVHDINLTPYDPSFTLDLAKLDCKLGFTDIGVANAYKALLLTRYALDTTSKDLMTSKIRNHVRKSIFARLQTRSFIVIDEELEFLQKDALTWVITGLLGCGASWDSLVLAKKASKTYPEDRDLLDLQVVARNSLTDRLEGLKASGIKHGDLIALGKEGKIFQRTYPWLPEELHVRTSEILQDVNANFGRGSCEVRPARLGPSSRIRKDRATHKTGDLGPLGVFATTDIKKGDIILVDHSVVGASSLTPVSLLHCDACHAALIEPHTKTENIVYPKCCGSVAFCSYKCHDKAIASYHPLICGQDFSWLYKIAGKKARKSQGAESRWVPRMFLRIAAIVLTDLSHRKRTGLPSIHPLQHPQIARMAANYCSPNQLPIDGHTWKYFDNIVAPAKIMLQLGIDIFTTKVWTPEVVQTIYWRISNNASMCSTSLWSQAATAKDQTTLVSLNSSYLFFNHCCFPNVDWHGTVELGSRSTELLDMGNGENLKPGSNVIVCRAARNVKAGEELKISYIWDPLGAEASGHEGASDRQAKRWRLNKWFEGGCGCEVCVRENPENAPGEK